MSKLQIWNPVLASTAEINLPPGLTHIGRQIFEGCSGLKEINLPAGLTQIGESVFKASPNIAAVLVMPDPTFRGIPPVTRFDASARRRLLPSIRDADEDADSNASGPRWARRHHGNTRRDDHPGPDRLRNSPVHHHWSCCNPLVPFRCVHRPKHRPADNRGRCCNGTSPPAPERQS